MFGIGFSEILVIAVVALVIFGPKQLPLIMRQAGRFFVQIRRTANDVKSTFDDVVRDAEREIYREEAEARRAKLAAPQTPDQAPSSTPMVTIEAVTGNASSTAPAAPINTNLESVTHTPANTAPVHSKDPLSTASQPSSTHGGNQTEDLSPTGGSRPIQ